MRPARKRLLLCLVAALPLAAAAIWPARTDRRHLITFATWNLEWLVTSETAHAARLACRSGKRASLPCDVAETLSRDSADIARLAAYARRLDADIIAFQEVENAAIARKVFPGYRICIADGPGAQHAGFAIRPTLAHRCGPALDSLSLNGRTRKAMSLLLTPAAGPQIELLAVHLKSGCSGDPLGSEKSACRILGEQAGKLGEWIRERAAAQTPFIVLGDFNRVSPTSEDDAFWQTVRTAPFSLLASQLSFSNCVIGQPWSQFIDHVLIDASLLANIVPGSARHAGYHSADAVHYRLPDHCPVSVSLAFHLT
jgi:endonuclease/exonuclease/phosphatase family metal-dependent hydrolase